jgi:hypothetical protein
MLSDVRPFPKGFLNPEVSFRRNKGFGAFWMLNCRLGRNKNLPSCRFKKILLLLAGLFLIVEGILSIIFSDLQIPIFHGGRVVRIIIGAYMLYKINQDSSWLRCGGAEPQPCEPMEVFGKVSGGPVEGADFGIDERIHSGLADRAEGLAVDFEAFRLFGSVVLFFKRGFLGHVSRSQSSMNRTGDPKGSCRRLRLSRVLLGGESEQGLLLPVGGDLDILKGSEAVFDRANVEVQLRFESAIRAKFCHGLTFLFMGLMVFSNISNNSCS